MLVCCRLDTTTILTVRTLAWPQDLTRCLADCHDRLEPRSAECLLRLVERLGLHSLQPAELRGLLRLLHPAGQAGHLFPYRAQVLHLLSSVARGDGFPRPRHYWDIQQDTAGISVPGIRDWPGPLHGFTFHCWLRQPPATSFNVLTCDISEAYQGFCTVGIGGVLSSRPQISHSPDVITQSPRVDLTGPAPPARRQLYSAYTGAGSGLECFLVPPGPVLVVAVAVKKEFLAVKVEVWVAPRSTYSCTASPG